MMKKYTQGFGWFAFFSCVSGYEKGKGGVFKEVSSQIKLPPNGTKWF